MRISDWSSDVCSSDPRCNYPTTRVEDQWIGSLGINMIVSFTLLVAVIGVGFTVTYPDPPVTTLLVIAVAVAALFPVFFFPISKSLWSAIDMAMRPPEPSGDIELGRASCREGGWRYG